MVFAPKAHRQVSGLIWLGMRSSLFVAEKDISQHRNLSARVRPGPPLDAQVFFTVLAV